MASSGLSSMIIILFICTISLVSCKDNLVTTQAALYVFGDSLFEAGNNNYFDSLPSFRSNYWPYGKTTFKFPTGRVSDGRTMVDFIAENAWLPLTPPNLQPGYSNSQLTYGLNFATTAAGVLAATFPGVSRDLGTQLNSFKNVTEVLRSELGNAEARRVISKAVYLFHIGANDYQYPFFANTSTFSITTKEKFVDYVIGNTTNVIEELYKFGARKFGFLSLGPFGCTPSMSITDPTKLGSCFEPVSELINLHNQEFPKVLRRLERELSGFKYSLHDFHTSLLQRINSPSRYGFKQGKTACCGSGPLRGVNTCGFRFGPSQGYELCENVEDHVFFDPAHLTEKAHGQIAELIWSGPPSVTAPYNLKTLFGL
ncbi:unnamed protein product [Microthlaspi erraticum]|uniref:GDSL esterase/lipase 4 n=1 Tax=Microthlaspi erraticum TaxID=1685480 RepID=A0A6D2ICN5_9BRAS|nr:unnamed protein product [Microthlaspi erraticum]